MANEEQLSILKRGVKVWNKWRSDNPNVEIDLSEANLAKANLIGVDLSWADLSKAILYRAKLRKADLSATHLEKADLEEADLSEADLRAFFNGARLDGANCQKACLNGAQLGDAFLPNADLRGADLSFARIVKTDLRNANLAGANLTKACLRGSDLTGADLTRANLSGADLTRVSLVFATIEGARLSGCSDYGVGVWDLNGEFEEQKDLVITLPEEPVVTVDNIKVAQFIYLILNNEEIRDVINTLTSKSVLILGRFSLPERKSILDALRDKLREYDLLPIVFDFDRPTDKDFTETIKTLAGLCYFAIADVTNPKSSPLELQATVPDYQIPFVPLIQEGELPFSMMVDLQKKYDWVLETVAYDSMETLTQVLKPLIIDRAMKKHNELRIIKAQVPEVISGKDFLAKAKE